MKRKSKIIVGASAISAFGLIVFPIAVYAATCNTSVSVTVGKTASCSAGSATISSITPGSTGSTTFTVTGTTNSTSGFKITAPTFGNLTSGSNTIAYNTSAAAGTQGYKLTPAYTSGNSWYNSSGTAVTSGAISSAYYFTNTGTSAKETFTLLVGTTTSTPSGTYTGTITWTCTAV